MGCERSIQVANLWRSSELERSQSSKELDDNQSSNEADGIESSSEIGGIQSCAGSNRIRRSVEIGLKKFARTFWITMGLARSDILGILDGAGVMYSIASSSWRHIEIRCPCHSGRLRDDWPIFLKTFRDVFGICGVPGDVARNSVSETVAGRSNISGITRQTKARKRRLRVSNIDGDDTCQSVQESEGNGSLGEEDGCEIDSDEQSQSNFSSEEDVFVSNSDEGDEPTSDADEEDEFDSDSGEDMSDSGWQGIVGRAGGARWWANRATWTFRDSDEDDDSDELPGRDDKSDLDSGAVDKSDSGQEGAEVAKSGEGDSFDKELAQSCNYADFDSEGDEHNSSGRLAVAGLRNGQSNSTSRPEPEIAVVEGQDKFNIMQDRSHIKSGWRPLEAEYMAILYEELEAVSENANYTPHCAVPMEDAALEQLLQQIEQSSNAPCDNSRMETWRRCNFRIQIKMKRDGKLLLEKMGLDDFCARKRLFATREEISRVLVRIQRCRKRRHTVSREEVQLGLLTKYNRLARRSRLFQMISAVNSGLMLEEKECYQVIQSYLRRVKRLNPGTVKNYRTHEDGAFDRMFLCFGQMDHVFRGCRPLIAVHACHMQAQAGGIALFASCKDIYGEVLILAMSLYAGEENTNIWHYFFKKLKKAIPSMDRPDVVIMSGRDKRVRKPMKSVFENARSAIRLVHKGKNMESKFAQPGLYGLVQQAAQTRSDRARASYMRRIREADEEVGQWLEKADKRLWTSCLILGPYAEIAADLAESLKGTMLYARKKHFPGMIVAYVEECWEMIEKKRLKLKGETGQYLKHIEEEFERLITEPPDMRIRNGVAHHKVHCEETIRAAGSPSVQHGSRHSVNVKAISCDCGYSEYIGFPCKHLFAGLHCAGWDKSKIRRSLQPLIGTVFQTATQRDVWARQLTLPSKCNLRRDKRSLRPCKVRNRSATKGLRSPHHGDSDMEMKKYKKRRCSVET